MHKTVFITYMINLTIDLLLLEWNLGTSHIRLSISGPTMELHSFHSETLSETLRGCGLQKFSVKMTLFSIEACLGITLTRRVVLFYWWLSSFSAIMFLGWDSKVYHNQLGPYKWICVASVRSKCIWLSFCSNTNPIIEGPHDQIEHVFSHYLYMIHSHLI